MSFDTRAGTRGGRQPSGGTIYRWMNSLMTRRIRGRADGKIMGFNALILTTIGRKSGLERTNPVGWFPGENGTWLIVASAGGATGNPAWYYNIAGNPDKVQIEINGRKIPVTATQLHGAERDEAWQQIITAVPRFAGYQQKTDREIPVIRLVERLPGDEVLVDVEVVCGEAGLAAGEVEVPGAAEDLVKAELGYRWPAGRSGLAGRTIARSGARGAVGMVIRRLMADAATTWPVLARYLSSDATTG